MRLVVGLIALMGVGLGLIAAAAVMTVLAVLGPILLILGPFAALAAVIVACVAASHRRYCPLVAPPPSYWYAPSQTYAANNGYVCHPPVLSAPGWQPGWLPVPVAPRLAQRRHPSRFCELAGGHR
ncbi:MAG: hypothetical protein JO191_04460 [Mycobacteriaceae bacterium]|nr:hypothetical protein [Mycobacteriaceae bacterium]